MGISSTAELVVLGQIRAKASTFYSRPPSLPGICPRLPYSAARGKKSVSRQALDELNSRSRCWTTCKPMIGIRPGVSAVAE